MSPKEHPELDDSALLGSPGVKQYQHIIGVCQWLVVAGRFDIAYAKRRTLRVSKENIWVLKKVSRQGIHE
jgi:hypothetical protein